MDCEKFETTMIDELYDELDELTSAAAKRHVAGCARCAALFSGLRATRRVISAAGGIPLVEPPSNLEERIIAAAREAQKVVPFRRRLANAISAAGSWAMRPQTAMAAVFLLMIGSSVVFLRGGRKMSASTAAAPMTVTEQGAPAASVASLSREESLDTPAANAAHGAKKIAPPEPPAPAASAIAMAAPTSTTPADEANKGFMDGLTAGQGRADKSGALGQMDDGEEDKKALDNVWGRRAAGPSNAGAIGGASDYAPRAGGGGAGAAPRPAARAVPAPKQGMISADPIVPRPTPAPASPPPPPAAAAPAAPAMATSAPSKDSRDADVTADTAKKEEPSALDAAKAQLAQKNYGEATRQFDALAQGGDLTAALFAARAVRDGSGCGAALMRYDTIAGRQAGTTNGNDALLEGGQCYRQLGQFEAARARLVRLLTVSSHATRAQRELDAMSPKAAAKPQPRKAPEPSQQQAAPRKDNAF